MNLKPIGAVRSAAKERSQMTTLGIPAAVELFPEFDAGLLHADKHSHFWVMAWLGSARDLLQVKPRGRKDEGDEALHGVFALRSPVRPNPIGLTAARLTSRDGLRLEFDRLDFIDATPVVDLKPYFVTRDMVFSARSGQVGRPADRAAIVESLLMQGEMFCGGASDDVHAAAGILADFRAEVLGFHDPEHWNITVPSDRLGLADAMMGMARVRLGDGSLRFGTAGGVTVDAGGASRRYALDPA